jgi:hypothetical protein
MADAHKNFAYSTIATAPSPAISGTSLVVASGDGTKFPTPPFNATVWPANAQPTSTNACIVRVTAISTDTFTIDRQEEGTIARKILVGDQIAASITAKTLADVENPVASWSPYILSSAAASGVQTLASASGQSSTGSLYVFPITVNGNVQFNQAVLPVSVSYVTTAAQGSNSYYSYFGLYSMNASTALSLMANGSFSMAESFNTSSRTLSFASTTNTSGYGYDSLAMSNTAQIVHYISGTRWFGLQFGSEMHLTNGIYYMGLLSRRSTANNSQGGMSIVGVIGQPIDPFHAAGSVSGYNPIGSAASAWGTANSNSTRWWGRHMVGFVTATSLANFGGSTVPGSIHLSALGASAANSTATIIPAITFQSNLMT